MPRPSGTNIVDLMDALKQSISTENAPKQKKPRKTSTGQYVRERQQASKEGREKIGEVGSAFGLTAVP
jgi:hypothetical protein